MNLYDNGKKIIFHNGWWHGNNSAFIRLLDEDVTIIALNNRFTRATYHVNQLANIFRIILFLLKKKRMPQPRIVCYNTKQTATVFTKKGIL